MRRCAVVLQQRRLTAFLSDVEGSTHYWNKYLSISRVLYRCPTTREVKFRQDDLEIGGEVAHHPLQTAFVYGGDAFDKGGDDLEFVKDLIQLKRRYGDRVTLLAGNRDLNKLNFRSFFTPSYVESLGRPDTVPLPFFMQRYTHATTYAQFLEQRGLPTDRTTRLSYFRWRLECTMGAQGLFEMRRAYLESLRAGRGPVTDEDVMHSFLDSVEPGGVVHEFLPLTSLAAVIDGVLFVHGAVTKENAGFVPSMELREAAATRPEDVPGVNVFQQGGSVAEWVDKLNEFHRDSLCAWVASPQVDLRTGIRGGGCLAAYCHRASTLGKTVVIQSFIGRSAAATGTSSSNHKVAPFEPKFLDLNVVEHLNHSGVFRICCGHKPVGDTPLSMQQPGLSVHVVDNSYCGLSVKRGGADGRGEAVQEVLLDGAAGTAIAHGRRTDGTPFEYSLDHPLVGIPLGDGWWTKAVLPSASSSSSSSSPSSSSNSSLGGDLVVLAHRTFDDYFNIEHTNIPLDEVERRAAENPVTMPAVDRDASAGTMMYPRYSTEALTASRKANARIKTKKNSPEASSSGGCSTTETERENTANS